MLVYNAVVLMRASKGGLAARAGGMGEMGGVGGKGWGLNAATYPVPLSLRGKKINTHRGEALARTEW
jgi:hypothetical protein